MTTDPMQSAMARGQRARRRRASKRRPSAFRACVANDDVDLAIRAGEIHVLLGENGAGKSTLIGMLSGMQQPDEGAIRIDGRPQRYRLAAPSASTSASARSSSTCMLVPSLTVVENRCWAVLGGSGRTGAARTRLPRSPPARRVDRSRRPVAGALSLGEQQQVEIVRALLRGSRS